MKPLKTISVFLIMISICISVEAQDTIYTSLLNVSVTNFEEVPSPGDKIFFLSKKTGEMYSGISDKDGKFQITLPNGSEYEVKIKSFDQPMNYLPIQIAEADYDMEFDIGIMYELPKTYTLNNVHFDTNSAKLKSISYESINELAELLLLKETLKIELAGHTDSDGEDEFNLDLSQRRAESVMKYIVKKGIEKDRLSAKGYGPDRLLSEGNKRKDHELNRRVEFKVLFKDSKDEE